MLRFDNRIRLIFSIINVLVPFLLGATLIILNVSIINAERRGSFIPAHPFWHGVNFSSLYLNGGIQMVSLGYLAYAVYQIKVHITKGSDKINMPMLLVNLVMFGLYMLSLLVYYFVYSWVYMKSPNNGFKIILSFQVGSIICETIAQLCLCAICWHISAEDQETPRN